MASLVGAITLLSLAGVSGPTPITFVKDAAPTFSRPNDGQFTRLGSGATPAKQYGDFTGKTTTIVSDFVLSDSIRVYVTEGDFSEVDIDITESLVPRVTDARGQVNSSRAVSDLMQPRMVDTVQFLQKSGTFPKTGAETVTVVVADAATLSVQINASDSVLAVVAEAVPSLEKPAAVSVSDTITVVLDDAKFLDAAASNRDFSGADVLTALVAESSVVRVVSGEVDQITITAEPFGYIRINEV